MNIIKIKKINKINFKLLAEIKLELIKVIVVSLKDATTRTVNDEKIDATEENLNINATTIQVKINRKLKLNERANKAPKYVATPLPPLNFNHIGKI